MKTKTEKKQKETDISCTAPDAKSVFVAGTFNDWDPKATPMKQSGDGKWIARIDLASGRHEFKFIVDGEWCCAPGCEGDHVCAHCVPNDCGTMNRVLEVQ
ncbi:MAG TPA: glycogen-binding domain-containing protein [Phycisphaerae bacterium]|nr:glycogen-binding domain-containing protein [Phycisphaerae bacterium]